MDGDLCCLEKSLSDKSHLFNHFHFSAGTRVMSCHDAKEEYGCSGKGETAFPGEADMLFLLQKPSGFSEKELSIW